MFGLGIHEYTNKIWYDCKRENFLKRTRENDGKLIQNANISMTECMHVIYVMLLKSYLIKTQDEGEISSSYYSSGVLLYCILPYPSSLSH